MKHFLHGFTSKPCVYTSSLCLGTVLVEFRSCCLYMEKVDTRSYFSSPLCTQSPKLVKPNSVVAIATQCWSCTRTVMHDHVWHYTVEVKSTSHSLVMDYYTTNKMLSISLHYIVYALLKRATKLIPELSNKPYRERLKILNLPTLKYRRYRVDMIELFSGIKGIYHSICVTVVQDRPTLCLKKTTLMLQAISSMHINRF